MALKREVGIGGAIWIGLGSMLGTGVFVALAHGIQVSGTGALLAVVIAGGLATCNGLSSAALAAVHPVSGGTYEYGHRLIGPSVGFAAGSSFLLAKSASAATGALAIGAYLGHLLELSDTVAHLIAFGSVVLATGVVLAGLRRTALLNAVLVTGTLVGLTTFVISCAGRALSDVDLATLTKGHSLPDLLHASALIFVAYTGYGRVATLGEEIHDPARNIPRAVIAALFVVGSILLVVTFVLLGQGESIWSARAPLEAATEEAWGTTGRTVLALSATCALMGVLLNLVLGLSRVWLAMGRRGDAPRVLGKVDASGRTIPTASVVLTGAVILGIVAIGDLKLSWTFSAFTVLVYYGIANLCALRLPVGGGRPKTFIPVLGLAGCLLLAAFIPWRVQAVGAGIVIGLVVLRRLLPRPTSA